MKTHASGRKRAGSYIGLALGLVAAYVLLRNSTWQGSTQLHTLMEMSATFLAFVVGLVALLRYYTQKNSTFLFVGCAFLGTALLDCCDAFVISQVFHESMPSSRFSLILWDWDASRLFLATLMFLSWLAWRREERLGVVGRTGEKAVYAFVGVLTLASFGFLVFVPLSHAYHPDFPFGQPWEFVATAFFLLALIGYLRKGAWRHDAFEHWVVLFLIVGFTGQALFTSTSTELFGTVAHLLKIVSYTCVLTGLFISMYGLFARVEEGARDLEEMYISLLKEVGERERSEKSLSSITESAKDAIISSNSDGHIVSWNRGARTIFGYEEEEVLGRPLTFLMPERFRAAHKSGIDRLSSTGESKIVGKTVELAGLRKDGCEFPLEFSVSGWEVEGDLHYVGILRDITERKQAEERIRSLAFYDPLTNLANRRLFQERLQGALDLAMQHGRCGALLCLDLDRFKQVNDTLGHSVGDRLLCLVAERLAGDLRSSDYVAHSEATESSSTVFRLGGDEFTVLLSEIATQEDAATVADRILKLLAKPFSLDSTELYTSASIGIAVFPPNGDDVDTLLRNADIAMYQAKERGGNNWQYYTAAMNVAAAKQLEIENGLRRALENQEFSVYYQPLRAARTGRVIGAEALLRWTGSETGSVAPSEFIPAAEKTGLIIPIGEWVLRTACAQSRAWQTAGFRPIRMSVNMSIHQFKEKTLVETIARILRETGLSPAQLELEITESAIMLDDQATATALRALTEMGIGFALDDFGTGYSSLSYLRRFRFARFKIDRSFVREIATNPADARLTTAIIAMAHSLGLAVVAEGVETIEQADFLRDGGCDELQGFLFSMPLPAKEFTRFLEKEEKGTMPTAVEY